MRVKMNDHDLKCDCIQCNHLRSANHGRSMDSTKARIRIVNDKNKRRERESNK